MALVNGMTTGVARGASFLVLSLVLGCAAGPTIEDQPELRSQLAFLPALPDGGAASPMLPIVATKAVVLSGERLQIRYLDTGQEITVSGVLSPARTDEVPDDEALRTDFIPPIVAFTPSRPETSELDGVGERVTVRSVEAWQALIHRLEAEIAGLVPNQGVVLDVLRQEEIFLYVNEQGHLRAVPIEDKPRGIKPARVVTLTDLLKDGTERIRQSLQSGSQGSRYLLFNTGDVPDTGFPFVFLDLEDSRVFFIQRKPEGDRALAAGPAGPAQVAIHALTSQVRSLTGRPVSSLARLLSGVGRTAVDSMNLEPAWGEPGAPVPPLVPSSGMDLEAWERELDEVTGSRVTFGQVRYLVDGEAFFPALIDAINSAQRSIRMRLYIFDNDDYAVKIADLLKRRSRDVSVQILLDGFGTLAGGMAQPEYRPDYAPRRPHSIVQYLRADSNIRVRMLSNPWMQGDHTKVIVIDEESAFLGGMNIGREYRYEWHDLMVETRGPVIDSLIRDFENTWVHAGLLGDLQSVVQRTRHSVRPRGDDDYPVRLLYTNPVNAQIFRSQIAALRRARNRVWIQNAYLTSDAIIYELVKARRRGVDVRVILPYRTDSGLIDRSNALAANLLRRNGVRVYIYPGMSHLKAAIYDGWACLGSANFDKLSLRLNNETNIATSHPPAVEELVERVFMPDFDYALELTEPLPSNWFDYLKELIADHL